MEELKHAMIDRLAQKKLDKLSIWAFLIQQCKKQSKNSDEFSGYIRWNTLYLKIAPEDDAMQRFMRRIELKEELNTSLEKTWYSYSLKDIRIRS